MEIQDTTSESDIQRVDTSELESDVQRVDTSELESDIKPEFSCKGTSGVLCNDSFCVQLIFYKTKLNIKRQKIT